MPLNFHVLCVTQRLYHKDYNQGKVKTHIPPDFIGNKVAKRCQDMLSDVIYRTYLHQWTCHPDQEDVNRARRTNEILSDVGFSSEIMSFQMGGFGIFSWIYMESTQELPLYAPVNIMRLLCIWKEYEVGVCNVPTSFFVFQDKRLLRQAHE